MTVARHANTVGVATITALAVCGCGGASKFANRPRPALPVNVTVIIKNSGVAGVSPAKVSGGQAVFVVTNQSTTQAEGLSIEDSSTGQRVASTPPINPQGATQVTVTLAANSSYALIPTINGSPKASLSTATVSVGAERQGSRNVLLTP